MAPRLLAPGDWHQPAWHRTLEPSVTHSRRCTSSLGSAVPRLLQLLPLLLMLLLATVRRSDAGLPTCPGFDVGSTSTGASDVIKDGIAGVFQYTAPYNAGSKPLYVYSPVQRDFYVSVTTAAGRNNADCTADVTPKHGVVGPKNTPLLMTVSYVCKAAGSAVIEMTMMAGSDCHNLTANVVWTKIAGTGLFVQSGSTRETVSASGQTSPSWVQPSSHYYSAFTTFMQFFVTLPHTAHDNQPFPSAPLLDAVPQGVAGPVASELPETLLVGQNVSMVITFNCKLNGPVDVTVTISNFPFAPSTFAFSYYCNYAGGLQAVAASLDNLPVLKNGQPRPGWYDLTTIRNYGVNFDDFSLTNTGTTFTMPAPEVQMVAIYDAKAPACPLKLSGSLVGATEFKAGSTLSLHVDYNCGDLNNLWNISVLIKPAMALHTVFSWGKANGYHPGFDVTFEGRDYIVQAGKVNASWVGVPPGARANITFVPSVFQLYFTFVQHPPFPTFNLQGAINLILPQGTEVTPILTGPMSEVGALVPRTPSPLLMTFWSKVASENSLFTVNLDLPPFKQVYFSFNKAVQWRRCLQIYDSNGNLVVDEGDTAVQYGTDPTVAIYMPNLDTIFSLQYNTAICNLGPASFGPVQISANTSQWCQPYLTGTGAAGGILQPGASEDIHIHFNCSFVPHGTQFTVVVPINGDHNAPAYSPFVFLFGYRSDYVFVDQIRTLSATGGQDSANVDVVIPDYNGLPLSTLDVHMFSPCDSLVPVMTVSSPVSSGVGDVQTVSFGNLNYKQKYAFTATVTNSLSMVSIMSNTTQCVQPWHSFTMEYILIALGGLAGIIFISCVCYCCEIPKKTRAAWVRSCFAIGWYCCLPDADRPLGGLGVVGRNKTVKSKKKKKSKKHKKPKSGAAGRTERLGSGPDLESGLLSGDLDDSLYGGGDSTAASLQDHPRLQLQPTTVPNGGSAEGYGGPYDGDEDDEEYRDHWDGTGDYELDDVAEDEQGGDDEQDGFVVDGNGVLASPHVDGGRHSPL